MEIDKKEIEKFLEFYAPSGLSENEAIFMVLLARKKYCGDEACPLKKGERYLAVKIITGPLDRNKLVIVMYDRLTEWFNTKWMSHGKEIPWYTLSASVFKDVLDLRKISKKYALQVMNFVLDGEYGKALDWKGTISHVAMKGAKARKHIFFDVDISGGEGKQVAEKLLDDLEGIIIKTHGGYHVLASPPEDYKILKEKYENTPAGVEFRGLSLVAIPGTYRGGSFVKIV